MVGRKKRYDSQSLIYHFPKLAPIEFFDRAEFPWLDGVEQATDDIRDEFLDVLVAEEGFTPYISYPPAFRTTSSRSSTIRRAGAHSTFTSWGNGRGERLRSARGRWRRWSTRRSPTSRGALPRRCSRC